MKSKPFKSADRKMGSKLNPFEVHINRCKHQVLGRKLKSDHGLPGVSKHKALEKRKKTLLQEYKLKDKSNQFIDQRIGERNSGMTEDDRIMARFTAERMRTFKNKKTKFNLSDSEVLTHRGQTLSEIEKFEDIRSDNDEDDETEGSGALKGKFVSSAHFGGGMLTKSKHDRESLIDELINESKKRKAERQRNKEETLEATELLDEEWKTLGQIITSKTKEATDDVSTKKYDDYDVVMRQLKFEPQGQATQRLKTDEEIAKEDKEKLEKLELERLKQLREIEAEKYGTHRSADDLDDGFSQLTEDFKEDVDNDNDSDTNSESGSDVGMNDEVEDTNSDEGSDVGMDVKVGDTNFDEGSDNELEPPDNKQYDTVYDHKSFAEPGVEEKDITENEANTINDGDDRSGEDSSDDEDCAMDDLTDLMPSLGETPNNKQQQTTLTVSDYGNSPERKKIKKDSCVEFPIELDLPYVLNVPEDFQSFKSLLKGRSIKQISTVFDRLVKSNHPSLEPGNKKKMYTLAEYIVQIIDEGDLEVEAVPTFVLHLILIKEFNREECVKMLVDRLEDFDITCPSIITMKFLVAYILLFVRPQGIDVLLPINKPALSVASKFVSQTDFKSAVEVSFSLLCCCLLLQDAKNSSTVYTEALHFLQECVKTSVMRDKSKNNSLANNTPKNGSSAVPAATNDNNCGLKLRLTNVDGNIGNPDETKVLYCSVILLCDFVKIYRKYPHSKLLFKQIYRFTESEATSYPVPIKDAIIELNTLLQVLDSAVLPPLVKAAKKPKTLRQYEPSFHTVTVGKSMRGLPAEKQEEIKLLHKYKHELKGAMRELRRDRVFLANVKLKEKAISDEQRIKKVKEIFGAAAAQQGELRSLKRKK